MEVFSSHDSYLKHAGLSDHFAKFYKVEVIESQHGGNDSLFSEASKKLNGIVAFLSLIHI